MPDILLVYINIYRVGQKEVSYCTFSISSLDIHQFSQFFTDRLEEICYSVARTPHLLCCYTILWKWSVSSEDMDTVQWLTFLAHLVCLHVFFV